MAAPKRIDPGVRAVELREVTVRLPSRPYTIHVGPRALAQVGELVPPPAEGQAAAVVADETTAALFGPSVMARLAAAGWRPHQATVAPGEGSKTLATAGELWGQLAAAGLDRASAVFAVGGGVIGDLAGFVAATYMRGIDFVTVPTTLLAQVDSSVGGKVGVDLPQAKNLVGAFHQPRAVVADPEALSSLPDRQFAAGLGEAVKHAAIADADLFARLWDEADQVLGREPSLLAEIVACNCEIKASVVCRDPEERTGVRAVLNYGHTIGHALERGCSGWALLHGEAVAIGMVAESRAAARLGLSDREVPSRLEALLGRLGVPTLAPRTGIDLDRAIRALRADKKIVRGKLALPVVPAIGSVELTDVVPVEELVTEMEGLLR
jgi:3-dehydroquinate synthase